MITYSKKTNLTNPTLAKIYQLIEAIIYLDDESTNIFLSLDDLATKIEQYRMNFIIDSQELKCHWGDMVTVAMYGDDTILISDQRSGEYIKLIYTKKNIQL